MGGGLEAGGQDKVSADLGKTVFTCLIEDIRSFVSVYYTLY